MVRLPSWTLPFRLALGACAFAAAARAQLPPEIAQSEWADPPTRARLASLIDYAGREGWASLTAPLRAAALGAYGRGRLPAAEVWFDDYRWSSLFSESQGRCVADWIRAVKEKGVAYDALSGKYPQGKEPLGALVSSETQAWLLGHPAFSREFFALLSSVDYLPAVLRTLDEIRFREPARFARYASLALAVAVVYDVPPPPWWPHAQVSAEALPRRLPAPFAAFSWFCGEDEAGRTLHALDLLTAEELKFVVDAAAPFAELTWSQLVVQYRLDHFDRTYFIPKYRMDRVLSGAAVWTGQPYTLQSILAQGGICVDQAYFASEAGKARGIPTLLFSGAGRDSRHAWFGYLDENRHWRYDAGRLAEQRFVTGRARDPQTWLEISDHELQFLSERFHLLPSYAQSHVHAEFAADLLGAGDAAGADRAARSAVNYEPRNLVGWEMLLAANARAGMPAAAQEGVMREAARAFHKYPDLELGFLTRVEASLRARGEGSVADYEERSRASRLHGDRSDLSVQEARDILLRSLASDPPEAQGRTYESLLKSFGAGSGVAFFDQVVVVFAEHLAQAGDRVGAERVVVEARSTLRAGAGSQLDHDFDALIARIRALPSG